MEFCGRLKGELANDVGGKEIKKNRIKKILFIWKEKELQDTRD